MGSKEREETTVGDISVTVKKKSWDAHVTVKFG